MRSNDFGPGRAQGRATVAEVTLLPRVTKEKT